MNGYIYKTTNLVNNKIYIGQHLSYEFDPCYIGSGVVIQKAIKKYGRNNFKCEVIEYYDESLLDEKEIFWIAYYNSTNPDIGYNISFGGKLGTNPYEKSIKLRRTKKSRKPRKMTEEHKEKIRQAHIGKRHSQATKQKISETRKATMGNKKERSNYMRNLKLNKKEVANE